MNKFDLYKFFCKTSLTFDDVFEFCIIVIKYIFIAIIESLICNYAILGVFGAILWGLRYFFKEVFLAKVV